MSTFTSSFPSFLVIFANRRFTSFIHFYFLILTYPFSIQSCAAPVLRLYASSWPPHFIQTHSPQHSPCTHFLHFQTNECFKSLCWDSSVEEVHIETVLQRDETPRNSVEGSLTAKRACSFGTLLPIYQTTRCHTRTQLSSLSPTWQLQTSHQRGASDRSRRLKQVSSI